MSKLDIYKIPVFEADDRFQPVTASHFFIKKVGLRYAYQIENSSWFVFKNGETVDDLCFADASSNKLYTVDEFILSYSIPPKVRTLMTYFFVKLGKETEPVGG